MNLRRLIALVIILSLLFTSSLYANEKLLFGREYFKVLHKALLEAEESIYIAMYIMSVPSEKEGNNPVLSLLEDLIGAKERGVYVKVILDDTKFNVNYNAFRKLKEAGIEVGLDSPGKLLHGKGIVIDKRLVFIGSTNWTRASINDNHEFSVMAESPDMAVKFIDYISSIKITPDIPFFPNVESGVNIPSVLLTDKDGLSLLFTNHAEKAFDLYLYIIKEVANGVPRTRATRAVRGQLKIVYKDLAQYLGYDKNYYFNVRQPMNALIHKYHLIKHQPWSKHLTLTSLRGAEGDEAIISIPTTYWTYGYDKSISFKAKYMYLVSLLEAKSSSRNPYWFRSNKDLAMKYKIGERSVSTGINELERANILEVMRHIPRDLGEWGNRPANVYRLNRLVSKEEFKKGIERLNKEYGEDIVSKAVGFSNEVNEPLDIANIEVFIGLIREYGYDRVKEVMDIVRSKRLETGFRSTERVLLLLKQG